jgi:hypothetical protein
MYLSVVKRPVSLVLTNSSYLAYTKVETPVDEGYITGQELGYETEQLLVGFPKPGYPTHEYVTYLGFDVSDIPAGLVVLSARVKVYCCNDYLTDTMDFSICRVTSQWFPQNISYYNQPTVQYVSQLAWSPSAGQGFWVWDVTSDVQSWYNGSVPFYGYQIRSYLSNDSAGSCELADPILELTCVPSGCLPISLGSDLVDGASGDPVSGVNVAFSINGEQLNVPTNSSGWALWNWSGPVTGAAYTFTASYAGNDTYEAASNSLCLDFRTSTSLALNYTSGSYIHDGDSILAFTHQEYDFSCEVYPAIATVEYVPVYVNGSLYQNLTVGGTMSTCFSWNTTSAGAYFFNVSYGGDSAYMLSQIRFAVLAQVSPVCLSFNATPSEFAPGENVTLYAQAVNPLDGKALQGVNVTFLQNGTSSYIGPQYVTTGSDGVASVTWQHQSSWSICTVNATVESDNSIGNCTLAVQPVTLTVGNETQLLLQAWRDPQDTGHTIYAQLMDGSGCPFGTGYTVTLAVNNTAYTLQTNSTGYVTLHLALQPGDTSANMYEVMATFKGTNPRSANLTALDPYGDQYAVCTTNQYDLRPSTNSSTLAVLLQTTDAITATKTMEQMQQEAQQSGWMPPAKAQFTLWYPWFRMHYQFVPNGIVAFDVGVSPLPFGNTVTYSSNFSLTVTGLLQKVIVGIATAVALSDVVGQIAAQFGPEGFLAALLISTETKVLSFTANLNSADGLISVFFGALVTTVIGYVKTLLLSGIEIFSKILECATDVSNLWDVGFGALYSMISIPMNIAFMYIVVQRAIQLGVNFL